MVYDFSKHFNDSFMAQIASLRSYLIKNVPHFVNYDATVRNTDDKAEKSNKGQSMFMLC